MAMLCSQTVQPLVITNYQRYSVLSHDRLVGWGGIAMVRTRTMGILVFGPLMTDSLTFFVFRFSDILLGKYRFLVIAPVIEGMLGTPSSTMTAETSARNFSLLVGVFYVGSTLGPVVGGFLNQQTSNVMAAFYAATLTHCAHAAIAWFAMPESITKTVMAHARSRYAHELASVADMDVGPFRRQGYDIYQGVLGLVPIERVDAKVSTQLPAEEELEFDMVGYFCSANKCCHGEIGQVLRMYLSFIRSPTGFVQ
ncbi:hypothetical protein J3R82DRAFT_1693 [Butyriboletus roseoflavus]|nr:hypothetical protein J3R82DRAFT_1693 [Butyriboletus roseoflavus]